jgi:hypothetical protein
MLPEPGMSFGLEVHINDDDDGGDREGKMAWFATEVLGDVAWDRPDAFANVRLGD